jgi:hypothetical protein
MNKRNWNPALVKARDKTCVAFHEFENDRAVIHELQKILSEQLDGLRENKTTNQQARNVARSVGKLLQGITREIKYERERVNAHTPPEVIERRKKLLAECRAFLAHAK